MHHRTCTGTWQSLFLLALSVCVLSACDTPDPPHQATAQQIAQMDSETGTSSSVAAAVDFGALIERIGSGSAPEDRDFALREYVFRANALPQLERVRRLEELERVLRANRGVR